MLCSRLIQSDQPTSLKLGSQVNRYESRTYKCNPNIVERATYMNMGYPNNRCVKSILSKIIYIWGLGPLSPFYALSAAAARASCNRWMVRGLPASNASPSYASLRCQTRGKAKLVDRSGLLCSVICIYPRIFCLASFHVN